MMAEWLAEIRFDAGIALPEMRADKEALQPKRQWLIDQTPTNMPLLRKEAEKYVRECLTFQWVTPKATTPLDFTVSFPEWETSPPSFANPYTDLGFAYFSIQCLGNIPDTFRYPPSHTLLKVTTQTTHSDTNAWGLTALSPPTRQITNIALAQCYPTHRSGLIHQPPRLRIPSCHP
ncbi:hypothetical protein [Rubritalea tangerina]|uniref:hypothetical protein n=1 Tax=Rubritalea tangerina TaxID=430798 RepID=UPI0036166452